jgi:hypothetical protein
MGVMRLRSPARGLSPAVQQPAPQREDMYRSDLRPATDTPERVEASREPAGKGGTTMRIWAITLSWDGRNSRGLPVASGAYLYRLTAGDFTATRRMLLTR